MAGEPPRQPLRRSERYLFTVLVLRVMVAALALGAGVFRTNPYVPPGHEGYVYERPRVFGKGGFLGTVSGPGNFGLSLFRNEVINVDVRPATYTEAFDVLGRDDLRIALRFHAVIAVAPGHVVQIVDALGGPDWYPRFVREPFRTHVRESVRRRATGALKRSMPEIAREVEVALAGYLRGTPFGLVSLVVGDIEYPPIVARAVESKLAARQLLEEKDTETAIALKDAAIEVERASGQADAQRIIGATLTPDYLQHEAIEAQAALARSQNSTVVYVRLGPVARGAPRRGGAAPR